MSGTATTEAPDAVRDAAAGLDLDHLTQEVSGSLMRDVFGGRRADPEFTALVAHSTHGNLANIQGVFSGRLRVRDTRASDGALELAGAAAELRLPQTMLERAYRSGQNRFWAAWFRTASGHARASGTPLETYLGDPSEQLFDYIGHVLEPVGAQYQAVAAEQTGGGELLRETVLRRIATTCEDVPADEVERVLGYPVLGHHAYVIARIAGPAVPDALQADLRRAAGAVAVLPFRESLGSWGVWLALRDPAGPAVSARVRRALEASGIIAAVAAGGDGVQGMRAARTATDRVARVQRALGDVPRVVCDQDVRLETLLLDDPERADGFVRAELGPLAVHDERAERLRSTLLTWLSTGSHVSAAATLGVHEHTIRNRIREIEALLGLPVSGRRAELQVALRLHRVSPAPAGPGSPEAPTAAGG
ncbi:PucR family transcriptional regulator [Patulibacter minatonensis]|uniref:PucR family transcriptional regulator n=1 Tax=Patulibacter minatonensis TaxID=298163 RepID=UPI00055E356C|nr:helix-turn-helix domain-containing protein [Patulibacter minatonensis]